MDEPAQQPQGERHTMARLLEGMCASVGRLAYAVATRDWIAVQREIESIETRLLSMKRRLDNHKREGRNG